MPGLMHLSSLELNVALAIDILPRMHRNAEATPLLLELVDPHRRRAVGVDGVRQLFFDGSKIVHDGAPHRKLLRTYVAKSNTVISR